MKTRGIHHITAIASDPQKNIDFYAEVLGLRFIKQTVNFDDPTTYHFYYADRIGTPGTVLTFFPWPGAKRGQRGTGQATAIGFSIPKSSLGFWLERFITLNIKHQGPKTRFGEKYLEFEDPDGLPLELVGTSENSKTDPWGTNDIPVTHAIRAFHSTTLWEEDSHRTAEFIQIHLGYELVGSEENLSRYRSAKGEPGANLDIRHAPGFWRGTMGAGIIHHIAFRAPTDEVQLAAREEIEESGTRVTPQIDRKYFHSIYFREPGNVLFEIATDGPGFTIDESVDELGKSLQLPAPYKSRREEIEKSLLPIHLPGEASAHSSNEDFGFAHRWIPRQNASRTLLLLHGTGGDENAMIPLGQVLDPTASILSPRGQVSENGMARYFRRFAPGVLDEEDLKNRAAQLEEFLQKTSLQYSFDLDSVVAVGYSNGANFAAGLLFLYPDLIKTAILLRPMIPFEPKAMPDLSKTRILISAGDDDPAVPREQPERLFQIFSKAGADAAIHWTETGHEISEAELAFIKNWLNGPGQ
ncbi:VOC family protein [Candidatus Acetothermia bacterium]|nr:VOC family protein [Candidatus Acetothermia bacterium]MBI3643460.1 VOC family protein [Candidatus Acetothermia bacterium]